MTQDSIIAHAKEHMAKSVAHTSHEFGTLHTGKASPAMVDSIQVHVESYGATVSLRDIAAVTTPEPRLIAITPWDKGTLKEIEKAILVANVGLNPSIQGHMLRVPVPELSGERRQELVRVAHKMAEEGRVAIRRHRHEALDQLKKLQKAGSISEDDQKRADKEIQNLTDKHIAEIGRLLTSKEKDLTTV